MYFCEKCQKEVKEKFASGRFCSQICANSRMWTSDDKKKKSESVKNSKLHQTQLRKLHENSKLERIEKICPICNVSFEITQTSTQKYCSLKCSYENPNIGGARKGSGHSKSGWYKGIYCGSTWELAFVIWAFDKKLPIERCNETLLYTYEGKTRDYHPDFVINEIIIEIKGYETSQTLAKREQNSHVVTLFKEELKHVFKYVKNTYGHDFIRLYEGNPHNKKHNSCQICGLPCRKMFCSQRCSLLNNRKLRW